MSADIPARAIDLQVLTVLVPAGIPQPCAGACWYPTAMCWCLLVSHSHVLMPAGIPQPCAGACWCPTAMCWCLLVSHSHVLMPAGIPQLRARLGLLAAPRVGCAVCWLHRVSAASEQCFFLRSAPPDILPGHAFRSPAQTIAAPLTGSMCTKKSHAHARRQACA